MEDNPKKPQVSILAFLFSFANVLGILYVTALPDLTQYFQITKTQAQNTLSFYLAGCVLAQFVYPALSKAIGRKPCIYTGCSLTLLGSLLCLISIKTGLFSLLLFGRTLTAFGAACGPISTNALITDTSTPAETRKIFSYLMSGFIIFPSIGVALGAFITQYLAWESCFYFMLAYAIFVFALCIFLPKTGKPRDLGHLHLFRIAKAYIKQFSSLTAILYSFIVASASIILYVFSAEAPFIAQNQLNISALLFGLYNLIPNVGFFLGGIISACLSHKIPSKILVLFGSCGFFLLSIFMWVLFDTGFINGLSLFGMPFLIFFASAIILPNGQACVLSRSEDKPYMASLLYIIQYLWIVLSIAALQFSSPLDASILPIVYSCSGALMILLWLIVQNLPQRNR